MNSKLFKPLNEQIQVIKIKRQGITDSERDLLIESIINDNAVEVLTEDLNTVSFYEDLNNDSLDEVIFEGMDIYDLIDTMEERDVTLGEAFDLIDSIYNHTMSLDESVINENKSISAYDLMLLEDMLNEIAWPFALRTVGSAQKRVNQLKDKAIKKKNVRDHLSNSDSDRAELKRVKNLAYNKKLSDLQRENKASRDIEASQRKADAEADIADIRNSGSHFAGLKTKMRMKKYYRDEAEATKQALKQDKQKAKAYAKEEKRLRRSQNASDKVMKKLGYSTDPTEAKLTTRSERSAADDIKYDNPKAKPVATPTSEPIVNKEEPEPKVAEPAEEEA